MSRQRRGRTLAGKHNSPAQENNDVFLHARQRHRGRRRRGRALAISMLGSSYLADGAAGVALIGVHLAVGYVLIAGFAKLVPRQAP